MINWSPDDREDRYIYRAKYEKDPLQCLVEFKNMDNDNAEASWNMAERETDPEHPLCMKRRVDEWGKPCGLSFFSFAEHHETVVLKEDLPTVAEGGDTFSIIVHDTNESRSTLAYTQLINKKLEPKKIVNAVGRKVSLKALVCYRATSEHLQAGGQFECLHDDNPQNHRTVCLREGIQIGCVQGRGNKAFPSGAEPPLLELLDFRIHCFRFRASAEPRPLQSYFDEDVYKLAHVLFMGFELCEFEEEDLDNINAVLRFLDINDYSFDALNLLKEQCVLQLLDAIFLSDFVEEDQQADAVAASINMVRNKLTTSRAGPNPARMHTKLQVAVRYDVDCSIPALEALNLAFEQHAISDTTSVVLRYELVRSSSYLAVIDFACDQVPLHLLNFPQAKFEGRELVPMDPMIVTEAILDHDLTVEPRSEVRADQLIDLHLSSPAGKEVLIKDGGILSNKDYWGSKWQCVATTRTSQRRCRNKTHDLSRRCHLHRDDGTFPTFEATALEPQKSSEKA